MTTDNVLDIPNIRMASVRILLLVFMIGLYGCAGLTQSAQERAFDKAVRNYTYSTDVNKVVEEAKTLLSRKAYSVKDGEDGYVFTTGWKQYDYNSPHGKKRKRYLVKATDNQVHLKYKIQEFTEKRNWIATSRTTGVTPRDLDLEFELIERVEPEGAKRIKQKAKKAGSK